jgi:hypothetical protein
MKKTISYFLALTLLISIFIPFSTKAQVEIFNIRLEKIEDNKAYINFSTSVDSKAYVYFGSSADNLDTYIGNTVLARNHEVILNNLNHDQEYYYKVKAISNNGEVNKSYIRYFNTDEMNDDIAPQINKFNKLQITDTGAGFSFNTSENAYINVEYGTEFNQYNEGFRVWGFERNYTIIFTNLNPDEKYYAKITAKDKEDNQRPYSFNFKTNDNDYYNDLTIYNLIPESYNQTPSLAENAVITWKSNVIAESEIIYSIDPQKLRKSQEISSDARLYHKAILKNLEADTHYYYKIKMYSPINDKHLETNVYSFKTAPIQKDYLKLYYNNGDVIKEGRYAKAYLVYEDRKIPFENNSAKYWGYERDDVIEVSKQHFKAYHTNSGYYGSFYSGQALKEEGKNTIYVIDGKYKYPLANWAVFSYLNYSLNDIKEVSAKELRAYEMKDPVYHSQELTKNSPILNNSIVKSPEGKTVYLIANNKKMLFLNEAAFLNNGYSWQELKIVPWYLLESMKTGAPILNKINND